MALPEIPTVQLTLFPLHSKVYKVLVFLASGAGRDLHCGVLGLDASLDFAKSWRCLSL